jgi:mono/diheme cytochrome c family protein
VTGNVGDLFLKIMKSMKKILIMILFPGFMCISALAQNGEVVFKNNCAVCHKFGTKLVGPDLTGVLDRRSEDWVKSFIRSSQEMVRNGDPTATAIFEEFGKIAMPDNKHLSDLELTALINHISAQSTAGAMAVAETSVSAPPVVEEVNYTDAQVENGRLLFTGEKRFEEKGPACITCHNATDEQTIPGGLLAKDLTDVHPRMGDAGIRAMAMNPAFPAMTASYRNNKIKEAEAADIAAYLHYVGLSGNVATSTASANGVFLAGGGIGGLLLMFAIAMVWKKRKTKSVKDNIFSRQIKTI